MDFKEIQELVKLINKSNLTEFKLKQGDFELSIRTKKWGKMRAKDIQALQSQQQILPVATTGISTMAVPASQPAAAPPAPAPAPVAPKEESASTDNGGASEGGKNTLVIKSPIVGTFYRSSSPDKDP